MSGGSTGGAVPSIPLAHLRSIMEPQARAMGTVLDSIFQPTPDMIWLEKAAARLRAMDEAEAKGEAK